jgi:predicted protein tyrosine phosphatase
MSRDSLPPLTPLQVAASYWRRHFGLNLDQITPLLYVGGAFRRSQWPAIHALGVRAVLSMQAERIDEFVEPQPRALRVPVPDFHAPTIAQLEDAVGFIHAAWREELPVFVHCHAGVGRAPLTAAAALMAQGLSLDEALRLLASRRPVVRLMGVQRKRLEEWARML